MPQLGQHWIDPGGSVSHRQYESANEFWDIALKSLKAYVESEEHKSELVIHDRPNVRELDAPSAGSTQPNAKPSVKVNQVLEEL